ncbi:MAG: hypothetical protein HKN43_03160 [Rhodothermales bacterium]|nr:hypothetical protein [Rhodothermales bacterium]
MRNRLVRIALRGSSRLYEFRRVAIMITINEVNIMKYLSLFIAAVALAGCSLFGSDAADQLYHLWLTNDSDGAIYVGLLEENLVHVTDPVPSFNPEDAPFPIIEGFATRRFRLSSIDGYSRGDNIGIFVYRLGDPSLGPLGRDPIALFNTVIFVDNANLIAERGHIVIGIPESE